MRESSSIKRIIQLQNESGDVIPLLNVPIFVSIADGLNTFKTFGTLTWNSSEYDELLTVDTANNSFIVLIDTVALDLMRPGKYDINIWWKEADADYPDGKDRFFLEVKNDIIIPYA